MLKQISITDLTALCSMRKRGNEAANKLIKHLSKEHVAIDLRSADIVSMSFLDELVHVLNEKHSLDKVVFVTDDPANREKLERIAYIRKSKLYCQCNSRQTQLINPRPPTTITPIFASAKTE